MASSFNQLNHGQTNPIPSFGVPPANQQTTPRSPYQVPVLANQQAAPVQHQVPVFANQQLTPSTQPRQQMQQASPLPTPPFFPILVPLEREIPFRIMMLRYPEWSPYDRARVFVRMFSSDLRAQLHLSDLPGNSSSSSSSTTNTDRAAISDPDLAAYIQTPLHAEWPGFELSWHQWRREMVWRMDGATREVFVEEEREVEAHARALGVIAGRGNERR